MNNPCAHEFVGKRGRDCTCWKCDHAQSRGKEHVSLGAKNESPKEAKVKARKLGDVQRGE